jgi:hypothetical protein
MRADASVANGDTPLAALMRETAAATVDTVLAELRRHPIVHPEWLSLQDAAAYTGYSEQQFSEFVKRGIAPKSVLFSRNARRFKRSDLDAWCAAGGPSAYAPRASLALCTDEHDHGLAAARPQRGRCRAVAPDSLSQRLGKTSPQPGRHRPGRPSARGV